MTDELDAALRQLATDHARAYEGPIHATVDCYDVLEEGARDQLIALAAAHGADADEDAIDALAEAFRQAYQAAVVARLQRGAHAPLAVAWAPAGPSAPAIAWAPPAAKHLASYVIAWDDARDGFVYAIEPSFHQFGHAWVLGSDGAWQQVSARSYRLGSAEQAWTGGYDPDRGGVVGWNVDGSAPVGVLVQEAGLTVIAQVDPDDDADEDEDATPGIVVVGATDVPEVDSDWSEVAAIFGHDRARKVWVMLCSQGVYELDLANRWTHRGPLPDDVLPAEIDGGRGHGETRGVGAVWDAQRQQVVFWFVTEDPDNDGNSLAFAAWDGAALTALGSAGLPPSLVTRHGGAVVSAHPGLGVVVYVGPEDGLFHLTDAGWVATPMPGGPPRSLSTSLGFAPGGDALLGPGRFPALPGETGELDADQPIFFHRHGDAWTRLGRIARKPPLETMGAQATSHVLAAGAEIVAVARRSLRTLAWRDADGWREAVNEADGDAAFEAIAPDARYRVSVLAGPGGVIAAITDTGAIALREGDGWRALAGDSEAFGRRKDFRAAYDPVGARFVVWGGDAEGRENVHDTLEWHGGAWRELPRGPRPRDLRFSHSSHGFWVDHALYFDTALGRIVRVGFEEVAVLDGDRWRVFKDARFQDLWLPSQRTVAHDPASGETLVVCWDDGRIVRLDLAAPDRVAAVVHPPRDREEAQQYLTRAEHAVVDGTRLLGFPAAGSFAIDLAAVFALAASLGPRLTVLPPAAPDPVRLYRDRLGVIEAWFADVVAGGVRVRRGRLGGALEDEVVAGDLDALVAAARADGFAEAEALSDERLKTLGRPVWSLKEENKAKERRDEESDDDESDDADDGDGDDEEEDDEPEREAPAIVGRLGGGPSGLTASEWPRDEGGRALAFLLQLALPAELGGGGVAVFVAPDGTCTEEDDYNRAIRLTDAQLAGPPTKAPKKVAVAPPKNLVLATPRVEFGRELVEQLGAEDAALGERLEAIGGVVDPKDKVGGFPAYVQMGEPGAALVCQLDFDGRRTPDAWEDLGLAGVIYVFRTADGFSAGFQGT